MALLKSEINSGCFMDKQFKCARPVLQSTVSCFYSEPRNLSHICCAISLLKYSYPLNRLCFFCVDPLGPYLIN